MRMVPLASLIEEWQRQGKNVVGLHVRRGDYRSWENGRYFYGDDNYADFVYRIRSLLREQGLDSEVIVFSSEPTALADKLRLHQSVNLWIVDHYLMSKCDYLLGPPSTFTMWASFIGHAKYYHVRDLAQVFELSNFCHCSL